jgi:hypothetical protein
MTACVGAFMPITWRAARSLTIMWIGGMLAAMVLLPIRFGVRQEIVIVTLRRGIQVS